MQDGASPLRHRGAGAGGGIANARPLRRVARSRACGDGERGGCEVCAGAPAPGRAAAVPRLGLRGLFAVQHGNWRACQGGGAGQGPQGWPKRAVRGGFRAAGRPGLPEDPGHRCSQFEANCLAPHRLPARLIGSDPGCWARSAQIRGAGGGACGRREPTGDEV